MLVTRKSRRRLPARWSAIAFGLIIVGLAVAGCSRSSSPPKTYPTSDSLVTAAIDGGSFTLSNNSDKTIYHRVFPTEILPVIEWAPCLAPETCPKEEKIDPGDSKRISLRSVVGDATESITIFWWIYLDKVPGASIPPMEMNEFVLPLP